MKPKERNIGLDLMKCIAATLVCMLHFLHADFGEVFETEIYIPNITKVIYGICACSVPLFFMVNGTLLIHSELTVGRILGKILNLLKIRFVWGGILGFIICVLKSQAVLLDNLLQASFYLWFFEALAVIYLFLLLWNKIKTSKWSISILIFILIFPFLSNLFGLIYTAKTGNALGNLGHHGFYRLYGILYFLLPNYLDKIRIKQIVNVFMILMGLLLVAFEVFVWSNHSGEVYEGMNACFPTIGALLITVGMYSAVRRMHFDTGSLIVRYMSWVGRNCLGVYLFHMPIIVILNNILRTQNFNILVNLAICLAIVTISGWLYVLIKSFAPIRWCLKI